MAERSRLAGGRWRGRLGGGGFSSGTRAVGGVGAGLRAGAYLFYEGEGLLWVGPPFSGGVSELTHGLGGEVNTCNRLAGRGCVRHTEGASWLCSGVWCQRGGGGRMCVISEPFQGCRNHAFERWPASRNSLLILLLSNG